MHVDLTSEEVAPAVTADPDDDWIVATAVVGGADVICTWNKHLFHADVIDYCQRRAIAVLKDDAILLLLRTGDGGVT